MSEFKRYHPIVNFIYFVLVIGFSCFFMHPVCLWISFVSGFTYLALLKGKKAVGTSLKYTLPMMIAMALINPVFNHEGTTVIAYLPSGNPMTLESAFYGICAAVMLACIIGHFSCFGEIMTSDKIIYLFGRIMPAMSLVFSMTLRFVPRFVYQLKVMMNAQKCMGRAGTGDSIKSRVKNGLNILSGMTTWALENALETADSMKSRGYGLPGRTAFSIYSFDKRDKKVLAGILLLGAYTFAGAVCGVMDFGCFPSVETADVSIFGISVFAAYLLLCFYPVIIELREVRKWKVLKSKI